jgi:hypothetical protein
MWLTILYLSTTSQHESCCSDPGGWCWRYNFASAWREMRPPCRPSAWISSKLASDLLASIGDTDDMLVAGHPASSKVWLLVQAKVRIFVNIYRTRAVAGIRSACAGSGASPTPDLREASLGSPRCATCA